jgi:type I restriction enzyme M protein
VQTLGALVDPVIDPVDLDPDREYQFLRITYAGIAERGETALGREVSYATISHATAGDIVVSHINAVNGAICVMPDGMADVLVSNEFTVIRLKPDTNADPHYLWSILRTSGVVAEWLSGASGVGRHRVTWDTLKDQHVPLLQPPERQTAIGSLYREAISREAEAEALREEALGYIAGLDLEGDAAQDRLARAKPPR